MNTAALLVELEPKGDERGVLVAIEGTRTVPFPIARAYYIYDTVPGVRRGLHAHRETRQLAVCVRGSCAFLLDDGESRAEVTLDRPTRGLLVEPMVWHEMFDFTDDCLLLMLASECYDEADYIRDYARFREALA
jgi:dTDP-4-dehydrorhamnose 3,5-epimerase-like enzyme